MPELPDVEQFRHYMKDTSLKQPVAKTSVMDQRILEDTTPQQLGKYLKGSCFTEARRHGKFLFTKADDRGWLVMHFGMTGNLYYAPSDEDPPEFTRALFTFESQQHLAFVCKRMLGRIGFTEDLQEYIEKEDLGPDALAEDLDADRFITQLENRSAAIKTTLMNQSVIAGIGNICSDEILFQARLHPEISVDDLSQEQKKTLFKTMREVLNTLVEKIRSGNNLPDDYLSPHREEGGNCPVCETSVEKISIGSRSAYICPQCQTKS